MDYFSEEWHTVELFVDVDELKTLRETLRGVEKSERVHIKSLKARRTKKIGFKNRKLMGFRKKANQIVFKSTIEHEAPFSPHFIISSICFTAV